MELAFTRTMTVIHTCELYDNAVEELLVRINNELHQLGSHQKNLGDITEEDLANMCRSNFRNTLAGFHLGTYNCGYETVGEVVQGCLQDMLEDVYRVSVKNTCDTRIKDTAFGSFSVYQ